MLHIHCHNPLNFSSTSFLFLERLQVPFTALRISLRNNCTLFFGDYLVCVAPRLTTEELNGVSDNLNLTEILITEITEEFPGKSM